MVTFYLTFDTSSWKNQHKWKYNYEIKLKTLWHKVKQAKELLCIRQNLNYYNHIGWNIPAPLWPCFSTNQHRNIMDLFYKVDFYSFRLSHMRGKKVHSPGSHVFRPINMAWMNLEEGHPRNISTRLFENRLHILRRNYF